MVPFENAGETSRVWSVLLIGAEVLPGKITVKGGACAIAPATRPGAPLTVIFARRQDARREEDGPVRYAGAVTGGVTACATGLRVRAS